MNYLRWPVRAIWHWRVIALSRWCPVALARYPMGVRVLLAARNSTDDAVPVHVNQLLITKRNVIKDNAQNQGHL